MPRFTARAEFNGQEFTVSVVACETKWFDARGRDEITRELNKRLFDQFTEWAQRNAPYVVERDIQVETLAQFMEQGRA